MTSPQTFRYTRREFLKQTSLAAAVAGVAFPVGVRACESKDKPRLAGIGVGGKGWSDIHNTAAAGVVVAFCDVDTGGGRRGGGYGGAAEEWPEARRYTDWRKLLEVEHKHLDGVTVSTPDHMHAPITMTAIQLGLGTYTQKPLTRTVHEARQLTLEARQAGVATQMGNQGHSGRSYRTLVALVKDGAIGRVKEAHTWSNRPGWPQGIERPAGSDPAPDRLDWDLWLGVAPERPYVNDTYHPFKWRGWWDFGAGALGDMGCHIIDPVVWGLELGPPTSVRYEGPAPNPETFPAWEIIHYEFPGTKHTTNQTVEVTWYDGGKLPAAELAALPEGQTLPSNGILLVGEKGVLLCEHGGFPRLLPEEQFREYKVPELEELNHYTEWSRALAGEGQTTSNFDYAGPLTETVLLGCIAARFPEQTLEWDSEQLRFTNVRGANEFVRSEYRKGWEVPGLS
ncbi:MAG TPA: Gfo/Idh/MocA family oxidoreductase [Planctomycetaceae bacterium]|nr:Gfo/Idh/MocA family oxidoreductase [Planctomycetaceae bacterium]